MKTKILLTIVFILTLSVSYSQTDLEEYFAERPTTPGEEVKSDKENLPIKKESFVAKLKRYKDLGFKVAVVLSSGPITTKVQNPNSTSTFVKNIMLKGKVSSMKKDFEALTQSFTEKLNEAFDTDLFETVDMKKIPYQETKFGKVDDWAVTKYRMVITHYITVEYDYTISGTSKYNVDFTVDMSAPAVEYIHKKGKIKKQFPIRVGKLGFYKGKSLDSEKKFDVEIVEDLHKLVNPILGEELVSELQKIQDEKITGYIEKRKK